MTPDARRPGCGAPVAKVSRRLAAQQPVRYPIGDGPGRTVAEPALAIWALHHPEGHQAIFDLGLLDPGSFRDELAANVLYAAVVAWDEGTPTVGVDCYTAAIDLLHRARYSFDPLDVLFLGGPEAFDLATSADGEAIAAYLAELNERDRVARALESGLSGLRAGRRPARIVEELLRLAS